MVVDYKKMTENNYLPEQFFLISASKLIIVSLEKSQLYSFFRKLTLLGEKKCHFCVTNIAPLGKGIVYQKGFFYCQ